MLSGKRHAVVITAIPALALIALFINAQPHCGNVRELVLPLGQQTADTLLSGAKLDLGNTDVVLRSFGPGWNVGASPTVYQQVYVQFEEVTSGGTWRPSGVATTNTSKEGVSVKAVIVRRNGLVDATVDYELNGETKRGKYQGVWFGKNELLAEGKAVWVREGQSGLEHVAWRNPWPGRTYADVVEVSRKNGTSPLSVYEIAFRVRQGDDEQDITLYRAFGEAKLPVVGQTVGVELLEEDGEFTIGYIEYDPPWPGTVVSVKRGWEITLELGLQKISTVPQRTVEHLITLPLHYRPVDAYLAVTATDSGDLVRPARIVLGEHEIPL
ncbi:MAG: hypothetical protein A2289_03890 [Deltaproteobacteria bacterium RIFOXYA12_FULL_58_15]|nr:MAG: hypothetical protein A2289_03890 [Deltaproteobacteria bacterium RIFOXYA12_FULL_58_15]